MNTLVIERNGKSYDFNALPAQAGLAMLSRGLTHYFGSEASAKVGPNSSWQTKFKAENKRDPNEAEIEAKKAAVFAEMEAALIAGTVGTARGPKIDPLEAEMDRLAENRVVNILRASKGADGKPLYTGKAKPKDEQEFVFPQGTFTFEALVQRQLDKVGADIKAEAQKNLDTAKKRREAEAAKAAKLAADPAASLGL